MIQWQTAHPILIALLDVRTYTLNNFKGGILADEYLTISTIQEYSYSRFLE